MKPIKPLRTVKPGTPIAPAVSTKPSDRPVRMTSLRMGNGTGLGNLNGVPAIPKVVAKKTTGVKPTAKRRPKTGLS